MPLVEPQQSQPPKAAPWEASRLLVTPHEFWPIAHALPQRSLRPTWSFNARPRAPQRRWRPGGELPASAAAVKIRDMPTLILAIGDPATICLSSLCLCHLPATWGRSHGAVSRPNRADLRRKERRAVEVVCDWRRGRSAPMPDQAGGHRDTQTLQHLLTPHTKG